MHPPSTEHRLMSAAEAQAPVGPDAAALAADAQAAAALAAGPEAEPAVFTPAQVELAQQLRENSTAWLQEHEQHALSKNERHGTLEMAYSILLSEGMGPKAALDSAVEQILTRRRLTEQMGVQLCPSSPPSCRVTTPVKKRKRKDDPKQKKKKGRKTKKAKKTKAHRNGDDSDGSGSGSKHSSQSSSSSDSGSDSSSSAADDSDSESDSGSSTSSSSMASDDSWQEGKANPEEWDDLQVPLHISKKVQRGEFVDLWWFTPSTCRERHDDAPVSLALSGNTIKKVTKDRPKNFLEDWELPMTDFHWAIDLWRNTMKDENIADKTVAAWTKFNTDIKEHKERFNSDMQTALQRVHRFQRFSFANTSRRTKNMKKAIEKSGWSKKKKAKELQKLRRFDPSKFPVKQLNKILKKQSADALEEDTAGLPRSSRHVPFADQSSLTMFANAVHNTWLPTHPSSPLPSGTRTTTSSPALDEGQFAWDGTPEVAAEPATSQTSAPSAASVPAMLRNAAWAPPPRHPMAMRLIPDGWAHQLATTGLQHRYPSIFDALNIGLNIGIKAPSHTHISQHHKSATDHPEQVNLIIDKELSSHRYAGPYPSRQAVEELIGPFQTAPLGLRPKPNGKFRLIQDFSYPKSPTSTQHPSINSALDISLWPTTWYTFANICACILALPRSAQAFVRDVTSAFRQIPLHPSQWPGTVVEWEGNFYIDQFLAFGLGPACGAFGLFADAFADICRAYGIGPTGHWVDDNVFFRVPITSLPALNRHRAALRSQLNEIPAHQRGRSYWQDAEQHLHVEDYTHDVLVLPGAEGGFNCGISDIDKVSETLGWPWEQEKDAPWATVFTYGGLTFNIATREVSLPDRKRQKYLDTISLWESNGSRHQLHDAQQLLGQLQHATTVHEDGKFHIKGLLDFIRSASAEPARRYQNRHEGRRIPEDLTWWKEQLALDTFCRSFDPVPAVEVDCFCDGSTSYGAGVHIAGRERAFPLRSHLRGRVDIKTVESLSLEIAVLYLVLLGHSDASVVIHSDSTPVCGAFKKGRMAAEEANTVLERIAELEQKHRIRISLRWVKSEENKADLPSRGRYSPASSRLPPLPIPDTLREWFTDDW
ncbi:hypothetical protein A4X13_0g8104 [Tilletia indica]|uniref:Uncharacterized protein n=1 Tax=Tilletia indica TaxID=43049 RepID=A0A8T8SGC0_9BASI|nr:hypothetical protein A4X13_0g8104 [Tilletia indica]